MRLRVLMILIVVGACAVVHGQNQSAIDQWIRKSYEATLMYRSGDTARALELLGTMSLEEQEKAVGAPWGIKAQVQRIAAGWPPTKQDVVPWTTRLLRALGALHMEAALEERKSRDKRGLERATDHAAIAGELFALVVLLDKKDDRAEVRWILAMGLDQMFEGEFLPASDILIPHCKKIADYAPLLVACGSVQETIGSFPADAGLPTGAGDVRVFSSTGFLEPIGSAAARPLVRARRSRTERLASARQYFERAIALDSSDPEAPLRLGNVRLRQGDEREAGEILEKLLARPSLDDREAYLARLFLAGIRDRQNRLDEAAALLAKPPVAQSSLLARAHNAQRRGDSADAASFVERAMLSQTDDPWWGYRFGQYWVPRPLFKALREEARQ